MKNGLVPEAKRIPAVDLETRSRRVIWQSCSTESDQ